MIKSYKEMPIGIYFNLQALVLSEPDDLEWKVPALALLTGRTEEDLLNAPLAEFSSLMNQAAFLAKEPETERVKPVYKAGPFELVPTVDTQKVTTAQYIDFQTFCKEKDDAARVVAVMSCLMVPKGHTYCEGYDVGAVRDAIRDHITVVDALSLYGFFFERLLTSIRRSQTFSEKMLKRLEKLPATPRRDRAIARAKKQMEVIRRQEASLRNGAGLQMLTPFQKLAAVLGMRFGV